MPSNGIEVLRSQYPEYGWSSWFGGDRGTPMPSALPYGLTIKAPGSTGMFTPLNKYVKYLVAPISFTTGSRYDSTFQPPVGTQPSFVNLTKSPSGVYRFNIIYYIEFGAPLFLYAQITDALWQNTRRKIFLPGPGPPPLPLLASVGPIIEITPFNKRGWAMID